MAPPASSTDAEANASQPLIGRRPDEEADCFKKLRVIVHGHVEGDFDSPVEYFILFMIFAQTILLLVSTMKADPDPECWGRECIRLGDKYEDFFETVELVSVCIFTIEFLLRLWVCREGEEYAQYGPMMGRVWYLLTFFSFIDMLSIVPYWVCLLPQIEEGPDFMTAIRVFRLVRLFKADKYLNAFSMLAQVLSENGTLLIATGFYSLLAWFISAALLFYTECGNPDGKDNFQSIPAALFPTLLMLTGEFPLSDFTPAGRFVAGFIAVVAVAIFAVPTAVIGSGFVQAVQRAQNTQFTVEA